MLAASAGVVACFSIFYLSTAFALSHLTTERGETREHVLALQLVAVLFLALGIVLSAIASDRSGARKVLAWGAGATVVLGLVFGPALAGGTMTTVTVTLVESSSAPLLSTCAATRALPVRQWTLGEIVSPAM